MCSSDLKRMEAKIKKMQEMFNKALEELKNKHLEELKNILEKKLCEDGRTRWGIAVREFCWSRS